MRTELVTKLAALSSERGLEVSAGDVDARERYRCSCGDMDLFLFACFSSSLNSPVCTLLLLLLLSLNDCNIDDLGVEE